MNKLNRVLLNVSVNRYVSLKVRPRDCYLSLIICVFFWWQLIIEACDDNKPTKCDTAIVTLTVNREFSPPVFVNTPYKTSISAFRDVDSSILRVEAEDDDLVGDIVYGVQGVAPAPTYFSVDSDSGVISVAKDLTGDRNVIYTVSDKLTQHDFSKHKSFV